MLVNVLQYLVGDGEAAEESHDTAKHSQEGPSPTISGNLEREQEPHSRPHPLPECANCSIYTNTPQGGMV